MSTDKKPAAYVLVGLPGSGKSTWAAAHPEKLPVASTDSFIESHAAEHGLDYAEAFKTAYPQAVQAMKQTVEGYIAARTPFIWDQTNLVPQERQQIYNILHPTHRVIYVVFMVPLDVCLRRHAERPRKGGRVVDEKRIAMLARDTVFPRSQDPHDEIIRIVHPEWPQPKKKEPA